MGAVPGMLGLGGGANGTGFAAPQSADIQAPTTSDQVNQAYNGTQQSMQGQQALLSALQQQQGLQNQNQVYGQLQGIASGAVNPAQAQFAQNTAQNVGNQAALMAGQRGAGANVGLMARQAAQQGAATQQQAVGQEAAQQAQNQIAAIQGAGNMATTQAGQQIGQTNANVQAQQGEQANLMGAVAAQNQARVGMQSNMNQGNAALAGQAMQGQQGMIGGGLQGAAMMMAAGGGEAVKMADGGFPSLGVNTSMGTAPAMPAAPVAQPGPSSMFGKFMHGATGAGKSSGDSNPMASAMQPGASGIQTGMANLIGALGKKSTPAPTDQSANTLGYGAAGAMANAPLQSGNDVPADTGAIPTMRAAKGGIADYSHGNLVKASGKSQKAVKGGNSYSNDKIPAVLSEHEIVLPRSVTLSKDPVRESAKFVAKIIAQRKGKK